MQQPHNSTLRHRQTRKTTKGRSRTASSRTRSRSKSSYGTTHQTDNLTTATTATSSKEINGYAFWAKKFKKRNTKRKKKRFFKVYKDSSSGKFIFHYHKKQTGVVGSKTLCPVETKSQPQEIQLYDKQSKLICALIPTRSDDAEFNAFYNSLVTDDTFQKQVHNKKITKHEQKVHVKEQIGQGARGIVYRGIFQLKPCAIKQCNYNSLNEDKLRINKQELFKEITLLSTLHHPKIVDFKGWFDNQSGRTYGLVFELLDYCLQDIIYPDEVQDITELGTLGACGTRVSGRLRKTKLPSLTMHQKIDICIDICEGLCYLHNQKIMHRDIKPANILVNHNTQTNVYLAKIADVGESKRVDIILRSHTTDIGTFLYMAPELMSTEKTSTYSYSVDIYSFGILMWSVFSGQKPYSESNISVLTLMQKINADLRPDIRKIPNVLSPSIGYVIKSCLNREPTERTTTTYIEKVLREEKQLLQS